MQVYTRLQERLGLKDHAMVLNVMLSKIATNLKVYGSCDDIIMQTLNLFQVWHQHALYNTPVQLSRNDVSTWRHLRIPHLVFRLHN